MGGCLASFDSIVNIDDGRIPVTGTTSFKVEMVPPPLIQDADPRPDMLGWQAWAEPIIGAVHVVRQLQRQCPHDLVATSARLAGPGAASLAA